MGNGNSVLTVDLDLPDKWLLFSSEPAHIGGLKYSNGHHIYTNDLSKLKNIPGPGQLKGRKSDILRSEDIIKADKVANSIGQKLNKKPLKDLMEALTKGLNNSLAKARAIYRWLTIQPVRTIHRSTSQVEKNTVQHIFQLIENGDITYAQLFSILCGMVGVPCVVISGFAKGSTYEAGETLTRKHRADWNAVLINDIWWLVDPFWGACEMVGKSRTEIEYSFNEYYFLTDPEHLIYTHFPEVAEWQLLEKHISVKEFEMQVCLRERFFELDMKSLADPLCCLETKDGDVSFVFRLNSQRSKQQMFQCYVTGIEPNKKQNINDVKKKNDNSSSDRNNNSGNSSMPFPAKNVHVKTLEQNDEKRLHITIRFQEVGVYKVEIVGKEGQVKNTDNEFDWIAIYRVNVKNTNQNRSLQDHEIKSAASETHRKEQAQKDLVERKLQTELEEKAKPKEEHRKEQAQKDLVERKLQAELEEKAKAEEERKLQAELEEKAKAEEDMKKAETIVNEIDKLREAIHNAMESKKLDKLESAVEEAVGKGYTTELAIEIAKAKVAIDRLKRLQKLMKGVLELNQRTIAEIRSYTSPPEEVYKVMKATLLLLGNYEEETKDWKNVQALIGKTGKISLKRRVTEFDIESLQLDVALGSKQILEGTQFETVCITSAGAAAFFSWGEIYQDWFTRSPSGKLLVSGEPIFISPTNKSTGIISEMEQKYANNIASTVPRTTKS